MTSSKNSKRLNSSSSNKTIEQLLAESTDRLKTAGIGSARLDTLVLLEHVLREDRSWILSHGEHYPSSQQLAILESLFERRADREPLAYLTGIKEFYGLELSVTPDVLIPRPETEALVEYVCQHAPQNGSVLDLGTGSGAIAIAIKDQRPDLSVVASDVSSSALEVAKNNSGQNELNINFIHSDGLNYITDIFDVIVTNLPYVPNDKALEPELDHEPQLALRSGSDGLDHYRDFFAGLAAVTHSESLVVLEHDPSQLAELQKIAETYDFTLKKHTPFISIAERKT